MARTFGILRSILVLVFFAFASTTCERGSADNVMEDSWKCYNGLDSIDLKDITGEVYLWSSSDQSNARIDSLKFWLTAGYSANWNAGSLKSILQIFGDRYFCNINYEPPPVIEFDRSVTQVMVQPGCQFVLADPPDSLDIAFVYFEDTSSYRMTLKDGDYRMFRLRKGNTCISPEILIMNR